MRIKRQKGFTLVEILVVTTIIILFSSFSFVSFVNFRKKFIVSSVYGTYRSMLDLAKSSASTGKVADCSTQLLGYRFIANQNGNTISFEVRPLCDDQAKAPIETASFTYRDLTFVQDPVLPQALPHIVDFKVLYQGVGKFSADFSSFDKFSPYNVIIKYKDQCFKFTVENGGIASKGDYVACP